MSPLNLAVRWQETPDNTINFFLRAARLNLVAPIWSVICPSCRGPKSEGIDVSAIPQAVHCEDCNINFSANPNKNIQLTFTPTDTLREIEKNWFCMAGPSRTVHIKSQLFINPGESMVILSDAKKYAGKSMQLRCPAVDETQSLGEKGGRWILDEEGFREMASGGDAIVVESLLDTRIRVVVEDNTVEDKVLLAGDVLLKPRFRELFAADQWEYLGAINTTWKEEFASDGAIPMPSEKEFDLIVIGSGPAGESVAIRAAKLGARVAMIESREVFGGPTGLTSKAFRESAAKVVEWTSQSSDTRRSQKLQTLFNQRFSEFRRYIKMISACEVKTRLGVAGITLIHGTGSIENDHTVHVSRIDEEQSFDLFGTNIVLASGSLPNRPATVPFDGKYVMDASDIGEIDVLPRKVCIIGGGVIGCEYASILVRLNVDVTLVNRSDRLLSILDSDLSRALIDDFESAGVHIITNSRYKSAKVNDTNTSFPVLVELDSGVTVSCDLLLYAEGREGASSELHGEKVGIEPAKRGYLSVNENMQTEIPSIFAIGDLAGPPGLACAGARQGRDVADFIFGKGREKACEFPTSLWTIPELATVGKTKDALRESGIEPLCGKAFYKNTARGAVNNTMGGWLELVALPDTGKLVGVHIIGSSACELIHYGASLIHSETRMQEVANAGYAAVTYHDLYRQAAEDANNKILSMKMPQPDVMMTT